MFRNRSVDVHQFSMIPRAEIPRSSFRIQKTHKTTFQSGLLIPVYVNEVLPGDTFSLSMTAFARMATPIFPVMDNLYLESFFFVVPCRLVWDKWQRFMGEQLNPGDSIAFVLPTIASPLGGYAVSSIYDYMGLPTVGQVGVGNFVTTQSLPLRCYNLIWNEWFRDENLQNAVINNQDDGPDAVADYALKRRGKRHDYFTSCLPFLQKGTAVPLPLGSSAPVVGGGTFSPSFVTMPAGNTGRLQTAAAPAGSNVTFSAISTAGSDFLWGADTGLVADLTTATAATINQIRQAFQIQRLLERDARGGTRYTELVRAHFGVISPDARLQRPEYIGGGSSPININPVAQTSATDVTGSLTPQGTLSAIGTALARGHGFTYSSTEHAYIIGLVSVRADLTYQQGVRKMWWRSTRYDFYFPAFAMLGEQVVNNREIFCDGSVADGGVFGYQERWAEYRYDPSMITGYFRSTTAQTLDAWHLAQRFTALPTLNDTFIQDVPPLDRILAVGDEADGQQFLFDAFFDVRAARPMPLYSVPGMIDHF